MLPDQVRALPARPPSEVEWEDLLVRVEIAPRALRLAVEDGPGDDPGRVELLRTAVLAEARMQHMLEATIDGREVEDGFGVEQAPADPQVLVAEYGRLRFRSFVMVQRRGLNVWDWTVRGGEWDGVTTYQLFQAAARRDGELLAAVRRAGVQGRGRVRVIGLMSGTSLDGVDAALVEVDGSGTDDLRIDVVHSLTVPYSPGQREMIHDAIVAGTAEALCGLHAELGEWLAEAALAVCAEAGIGIATVDAIGSHGQTVWHRPPAEGRRGATLQLGDAATIAERTGRPVVSDFRTRDMAAGGQGAPLVPWTDQLLFAVPDRARALQNLGGIGNVTRVPPLGSDEPVWAFDTGPANSLIDSAVEIATGGRHRYDRDGRLAARGRIDEAVLAELLRHPYFAAEPPKSTGREEFGRPFVERLVEAVQPEGDQDWMDLVATLTELTARTVADAYRRWVIPRGVDEVVLTGGGARNPVLADRIRALLHPLPVVDGTALDVDPDAKEAVAFAVLAWAHLRGIPANLPSATGAAGPRVLGSLTPGA